MTASNTSPEYSLKHWKLAKWWDLNKGRVRLLAAGIAGLIVQAWPENPWVKLLFGGSSALIVLLALDTADFFLSEVKQD